MGLEIKSEDKRVALKIFLTVYLISALFFKPSPTFYRFVSLTKSLVHYKTTSIDQVHEEAKLPFTDEVKFGAHIYIDINPGLSFIAAVSYFPYAKFILPKLEQFSAWDALLDFRVSQFVMGLSTVIFFTALLTAVFFLALKRVGCGRRKALGFTALLYAGTPILFYSLSIGNGQNSLEMSLVFFAFLLLGAGPFGVYQALLSGLLLGLAVFTSITSIFFFPLFLVILWKSKPWLTLVWLTGIFLGLTPLLVYNFVSFGNPLRISSHRLFDDIWRLNFGGVFHQIWNLLLDPRVGLIPFSPFFLALALFFKEIITTKRNRLILSGVLIYLFAAAVSFCLTLIAGPTNRETWYLLFGGGGCRYLLPVIPFLVYVLASVKLTSGWKWSVTFLSFFVSLWINVPALFWSGGVASVFNHLLLFLKGGFHSYTIDLMKDLLILAGFNVEHFSLLPMAATLIFLLWWIWVGDRWVRDGLKQDKA